MDDFERGKTVYEVVVIGGGQAGLTAGYMLQQQKISYLILDGGDCIGASWRKRFSSLTLFTPNNLNRMAGFVAPHGRDRYLNKDEFADYLQEYAEHFELNVQLNSQVTKLRKTDAGFAIEVNGKEVVEASQVVVASGAMQIPKLPEFSKDIPTNVQQYTPDNLADVNLEGRRILVVGDGASGRQIAKQFVADNIVSLACGRKRQLFPQSVLGLEIFGLLKRFGVLFKDADTKAAQRMKQRDPFPDTGINDKALKTAGVVLKSRLTTFSQKAEFEDGSEDSFDAVIWAMGYNNQYKFIDIPNAFSDGQLVIKQGFTNVEGLYTLSTPWQTCRASALVCGVERDMKIIFPTIVKRNRSIKIQSAA